MQYAFLRRITKWMSRSIAVLALAQILCGSMSLAFADQAQPDPAGTATGDKLSVTDAAGNPFVVPEPTDTTAPDYAKNKKDFEEYQAQAAREPLALKLADGVGHTRIATNFSWTLLTGYLVLFMQAGFALLTCGLVRKKNAAHLMMLNFAAYVFAFLAYYAVGYAFQFGAVADKCFSCESRRRSNDESFPHRKRSMGVPRREGIFSDGSCLRCGQQLPHAFRSRLYGDGRLHYRWRNL